MSGKIQVIPPGLLGFLGVKNFGAAPSDLGGSYVPTLEMIPWSFLARAETLQGGWAAGSVGGNLTGLFTSSTLMAGGGAAFTVPGNEYWYVHDMTLAFVPGAAATRFAMLTAGYLLDSLGTPKYMALASSSCVLTNDPAVVVARDFFVPSGAIFGFSASVANAAATNVASLAMLITRLPV